MTTLSKKMLGYALGRTVLASDRPLIAEMAAAGGNASFSDLAVEDRHQPPVPQPRRARTTHRAPCQQRRRPRSRHPMSIDTTGHPSRRHFLRGVGVALALPWMESLPLFAQARRRRVQGEHAAAAAGHRLLLERRRADALVGEGQRRERWSSARRSLPMMPHREDMVFIQGLFNQTALRLDQPAPRAHERAVGRAGQPRPERDPRRHVDGPGASPSQIGGRTAIPSLVLGIEPNELRLEDGLSMIYGSSLSWVSPTKPATKEIYPVARVRSAGRRRHAAGSSIAASSTRCGRTRRACGRRSAAATTSS